MGHRLMQSYLEKCEDANTSINLSKLLAPRDDTAGAVGGAANDAAASAVEGVPTAAGLKLVVDAECCLDRLYGGKHADWLAGGQWNRMIEFLTSLRDSCTACGVTLVVFLQGALEVPHMREWAKGQSVARAHVKTTLKEIYRPRRVPNRLWVAPAGLRTALRLALRQLAIEMVCSLEEHRLEVMALVRDRRMDGLMARNGSYVIFNPPRYFAANLFKLTFKKEILTTEHLFTNLAKALDLHPDRFCVLGALLGNHILSLEDLKPFHTKLAGAKEAAAAAAPTAEETSADETSAGPASPTGRQNVINAVADFVRRQPSVDDLDALASQMFDSSDAELFKHLTEKLKASVIYYTKGTEKGHVRRPKKDKSVIKSLTPPPSADPTAAAAKEASPALLYTPFSSDSEEEKRQLQTETISPARSVSQLMLLRHQRGILSPLILQILTHRHVKLEAIIEDAADQETPSAVELYQDLRRRVYGILLDAKTKKPEECVINEWFASEENPDAEKPRPVTVAPLDPSLDIPSLESLWFGAEPEDGQRRLRAFLACMKANDDNGILDKEKIPRQYLILCAVLRYIMEYGKETGKPVLSKAELEAFLATAVCPMMRNVRVTKEMQLRKINKRGLSLGALFMQGVEYASLANDACGAPVPWQLTCPWEFFDGKIFHLKLIKSLAGSPLLEVCDNNVQHLVEVERMRDAILGNREFVFAEVKPAAAAPEAAAASGSPDAAAAAGAIPKKSKSGKKNTTPLLPTPGAAGRVGTTPLMSNNSNQKGGREAEIYAAAYAQAYVAYCSNGNTPMPQSPLPMSPVGNSAGRQQMEAEAYAKGYATAMAQSGVMGGPQQQMPGKRGGYKRPYLIKGQQRQGAGVTSPRPPSARPRGGTAQSRIIRQAAEYANYHLAGMGAPTGGRGGRRGGKGQAAQSTKFPSVDIRVPSGAYFNTPYGF